MLATFLFKSINLKRKIWNWEKSAKLNFLLDRYGITKHIQINKKVRRNIFLISKKWKELNELVLFTVKESLQLIDIFTDWFFYQLSSLYILYPLPLIYSLLIDW